MLGGVWQKLVLCVSYRKHQLAFSKYQLVWPSALARGWSSSDNAHVSIRNGIARSVAPAGLKGLIVRGCEVGLTGTRATATSAGVCCGDQLFKDLAQDRVQQRLVEPRAADCGSVGGSAEDGVSSGIQRRTVEQIVDFLAPVFPERISERTETSSQDRHLQRTVERMHKVDPYERISARSQLIGVPKFSCWDSVEMVKNIPQERSSERMCESPDQLWQRTVEQYLNLDACVEHDPAAGALVCERLRGRCEKVRPQLGGGAVFLL